MMKVLVTGAAGFIGSSIVKSLLKQNYEVIGLDCINSYYDTTLKYARIAEVGILQKDIKENKKIASTVYPAYQFIKLDLTDRINMKLLFDTERFDIVINMAAQAGVRYSLENPYAYIESNILGFLNILENCRYHKIKQLIYASSSSIYGANAHLPFVESDMTDMPVSIYAATKKSDELMAYSYSKVFGLPTTGVRFFTVYGPWGRPDMAPFLFMQSILEGRPIQVFNHGKLGRDFTYIDDIVDGIMCLLNNPSVEDVPYRVYNIGNSKPVQLLDFISIMENVTGRKAIKQMVEMQPGDVYCTYADISRMKNDFGYMPLVSVEEGISRFYNWYKVFYDKKLCKVD